MRDICTDKTSPYDIRTKDEPLIEAAISLGEWLAVQPESSVEARQAINLLLCFLRDLPNPPPSELNAEFGFEVCSPSQVIDGSYKYCWSISLCRAGIEIFSLGDESFNEYFWFLCPGAKNDNEISSREWIEQVSDPRSLVPLNHALVVDASTWRVKNIVN